MIPCLREKLFRSQDGGAWGTIPKLMFERKQLIPAIQQMLVSQKQAVVIQ